MWFLNPALSALITKLLNGLASVMYNQAFYFQLEKSSYGLDEVKVNASYHEMEVDADGSDQSLVSGFTAVYQLHRRAS